MAARKKKVGHGGARKGAGRPAGTGTGRGKDARWHRVAVMMNDKEFKALKRISRKANFPLATTAHLYVTTMLHKVGVLK